MFKIKGGITLAFLSMVFNIGELKGCGDVLLQAEDGTLVNARSMEFGIPLESTLKAYPRGKKVQSDAPSQGKGLSWESKYGYIGIDALGVNAPCDGLNEKGLSIGALWLPTTVYQDIGNGHQALDVALFCSWILGNFSTIDEVKAALPEVRVFGQVVEKLGIIPPLHFSIHDASGKSLVVEFIKGNQFIYDNPIAVLTNYPTFPWHIDNLRNYAKLAEFDSVSSVVFGKNSLETYGEGTGLLGIPGDWMPPSRFVRLAYLKKISRKGKNGSETINLAEHLFNAVDIPYGAVRSEQEKATDYTQWVVIKDLSNRILYYRTYDNMSLRSVNLKAIDLSEKSQLNEIEIEMAPKFEDLTHKINRSE